MGFFARPLWALILISAWPGFGQQATVRQVPRVVFPAPVDSSSPALRINNQLVVYNSTGIVPVRSAGATQFNLAVTGDVVLGQSSHRPYWIESTWLDDDGTLFAWYHHEPPNVCGALHLTAPQIGALVSSDGGRSFTDLGIILQNGNPVDCTARNGFFAGGNGDFSVVPGKNKQYFYFLFTNYAGPQESQGVAVARMRFDRRHNPYGAVYKYFDDRWDEPGIGGRVSAIFPANVGWSAADTDSFWGPSVHWNTYLGKFVMLLNHSCCSPGWPQDGVYISYNDTLANPKGWTAPVRLLDNVNWYPQIIGYAPVGTDKLAGKTARLYVTAISDWEIVFEKSPPADTATAPE